MRRTHILLHPRTARTSDMIRCSNAAANMGWLYIQTSRTRQLRPLPIRAALCIDTFNGPRSFSRAHTCIPEGLADFRAPAKRPLPLVDVLNVLVPSPQHDDFGFVLGTNSSQVSQCVH